jgi:hypothetical protein
MRRRHAAATPETLRGRADSFTPLSIWPLISHTFALALALASTAHARLLWTRAAALARAPG